MFSWIFHGRLKGALSFWGLVIYDVCYEDLCYEDASTIKEAVELIYEMIRDHEYNRGRDLTEWRISKLHRSILLRAYEGETEKLSLENKYN